MAQLPRLQPETPAPGRMPELPVSQEPERPAREAEPTAAGQTRRRRQSRRRRRLSAPQRVVDPTRPMVALTYDDGPHAVYTDQILDILEEHGAVATFFEVAPEPATRRRTPSAGRRTWAVRSAATPTATPTWARWTRPPSRRTRPRRTPCSRRCWAPRPPCCGPLTGP